MERHVARMSTDDIESRLGHEPRLLVEIGANDGTDTLRFATAFPECQIVAFEPDPRAAAKFESVMMRAGVYRDRVELVKAAISDEIGTTTMFMSAGEEGFHDPEWDKSSSICQPTRHLVRSPEITFPDDEAHRQSVVTLTLDTWWGMWREDHPECDSIDLIWCDPQGAQAKIIRGGRFALEATRWLYIEYYESPLYSGEPTLGEMQLMLPEWELVATYENENALFRNKNLE